MQVIRLIGKQEIQILESKDLLGDQKQVLIKHGEFLYRLTVTRQGKLILNK